MQPAPPFRPSGKMNALTISVHRILFADRGDAFFEIDKYKTGHVQSFRFVTRRRRRHSKLRFVATACGGLGQGTGDAQQFRMIPSTPM